MNDDEKLTMKVVDKVEIPKGEEGILCCAPGMAWNDSQVNGICAECGGILHHDADAPKLKTLCAPCAIAMMKEDGKDVRLMSTATSLNRAAATLGQTPTNVMKGALDVLERLLKEDD